MRRALSGLREFLRNYAFTWRAAPFHTFASTLLLAVDALWPTAFTILSGLVVGSIPPAIAHGLGSASGRRLIALIVITGAGQGLVMLCRALQQFELLGMEQGVAAVRRRLLVETSLAPGGIAHLEDSSYQDQVAIAGGAGGLRPENMPARMRNVVFAWAMPVGGAIILFRYLWWAPLLLAGALWVLRLWEGSVLRLQIDARHGRIQETRRAAYFRDTTLDGAAAKELRVFDLGGFVVDRLLGHSMRALDEIWRRQTRVTWLMVATVAAVIGSQGIVYIGLGWSALHGALGLAGLAMSVQAVQSVVSWTTVEAQIEYRVSAAALAATTSLSDRITPVSRISGDQPAEGLPRREIRLRGVRFRYPGASTDVFSGLDLDLPAGRSTAIVGSNGAGKTTLIKLIARLYDPTGGTITVDGRDLTTLDPTAWRRRLAVVFQDFTTYEMSARDNVAFGALEEAATPDALEVAAGQVGAREMIEGLPRGWETILSRAYTDGTDLSGGQWQRIALARAMLAARRRGVLILDEPTASLDVRAEAEIFDRFLELTEGLTTILISHRFSSVRHADRIVVIERGGVVEQGTHDELLRAGGRYAAMFTMQADRFR